MYILPLPLIKIAYQGFAQRFDIDQISFQFFLN